MFHTGWCGGSLRPVVIDSTIRGIRMPKDSRLLRVISLFTLATLFIVTPSELCEAKSKPPKDAKLDLITAIKAIEDSLDEAAKSPVAGFPPLQTVTISAQTTVTKEADGSFKIFIINIGGQHSFSDTSTLSFELKPPQESETKVGLAAVKVEDLKTALAKQIQAAKVGFLQAQQSARYLKTDKIEIQIGFTVSNQGNGGIDTGSYLPLEISVNGKLEKDTANTITLDFGSQ
jgi:hypothetical protein